MHFGYLALVFVALFASPAGAEIYRATDANGRAVFTDRPPAGEKAAPQPGGAARPADSPAAPRSAKDWGAEERAWRMRQNERAAAEARDQKENERRCTLARQRATGLARAEGIGLYRVDPAGERSFVSDQERAEIATQARADIERYCRR